MAERRRSKMRPRVLYATSLLFLFFLVLLFQRRTNNKPTRRVPLSCQDTTAPADAPAPIFVVAAGASRSGSTVLYNALRILLRIRDPNLISGWYVDLRHTLERYGTPHNVSSAHALRSSGMSVLVKVHSVSDWMKFSYGPDGDGDSRMHVVADAVFTTHRDVRNVLRSRRRMAWGAAVRPGALKDPTFCVKPEQSAPLWLDEREYARKQVWMDMARAHIVCSERLLESAGDKLKDDLRMEDFKGLDESTSLKLLMRLAKRLDTKFKEYQIVDAAKELRALMAPRCAGALDVHPVSHLHRAHVSRAVGGGDESDRVGIAAVERDIVVSDWLYKHGYSVPTQRA